MPYFGISDKYTRKIFYIFLVLLAIKFILSLQFPTPWIMSDEVLYDDIARNIWKGSFTSDLKYCQTPLPGYSICLSIAYLFSENKDVTYRIMLFINAILTSSVIFPAYFILKNFISNNKAFLGSILVCILPSITLYSSALISENLFTTLFLFSAWFIIESFKNDNKLFDLGAGFSIFYLFLTRAVGIAMVLGFATLLVYEIVHKRSVLYILKTKYILISSLVVPMVLWIMRSNSNFSNYSNILSSTSGGYNVQSYMNTLSLMFTDIPSFLTTLELVIHEIDYLLLISFFIFFIFTIFAVYKRNQIKNRDAFHVFVIYSLLSTLLLILITVTHMYGKYINGDIYYSILGRYIDPAVPIIFIVGLIGIDLYYCTEKKIKDNLMLLVVSILLICIFIKTFPYMYYKFGNMFGIYYIQILKNIVPISLFLVLFPVLIGLSFILTYRYKQFLPFAYVFVIVLLLLTAIPTYQQELIVSVNLENNNQIGRYLQDHDGAESITLMDSEDFDRSPQMWFLTKFWMNGDLVCHSTKEDPSGVYTKYTKDVDYIISSKLLPYQLITCSKGGYKLYKPAVSEEQFIKVPYTIDIGLNDEFIIENFHEEENQKMRWTKNTSNVLVEYPEDSGHMKLTIKTGGHRPPDNPAYIELYTNGIKIGEVIKPSGSFIYSFNVPQYCLNEYYQIVEIKTNTWRPSDYGSPDKRDLGIQIDWIKIDKAEPKTLDLLTGFYGIEYWHNISTRWSSNNATIFVHSPENRTYNLFSKILSFYKPRTLQVYLNDDLIHEQKIPTRFVDVVIPVKLKEGENILRFYTPDECQRPVDIPELKNKDSRCLSLAFQNLIIL